MGEGVAEGGLACVERVPHVDILRALAGEEKSNLGRRSVMWLRPNLYHGLFLACNISRQVLLHLWQRSGPQRKMMVKVVTPGIGRVTDIA